MYRQQKLPAIAHDVGLLGLTIKEEFHVFFV